MAFRTELVRPDDLVHLRVSGSNLVLDTSVADDPVLVVEDRARLGHLVVEFPAQTVAEAAYFEWTVVPAENKDADGNPLPRKDPDAVPSSEPLDSPGQPGGAHKSAAQVGRASRLVFEVPRNARIRFSLEGLLDWSGLELSVSPIAAIGRDPSPAAIAAAPDIRPPHTTETSIELPYRLVVSPTADVVWRHRLTPFTWKGRTELWHTRLALGHDGPDAELSRLHTAPLRAIWSDDYRPDNPPHPSEPDPDLQRTAMSANDRYQLVVLTSAFHGWLAERRIEFPLFGAQGIKLIPIDVTVPHVPEPFEAQQLMISPLGGWLKSRGHWVPPRPAPPEPLHRLRLEELLHPHALDRALDRAVDRGLDRALPLRRRVALGPGAAAKAAAAVPAGDGPTQLDLSEWVHVASLGRDHYVRIVYEGELWPFRHRAALVKVTERKFRETGGIVGAYLMQRMFIVVREPEKTFSDLGNPFRKVRLTTLVTPDIAEPTPTPGLLRTFWVQVVTDANPPANRAYFPFHGVATDGRGNQVDFTVPLLFVSLSDIGTPANFKLAADTYNARDMTDDRNLDVPGQKVVFAEPAGNDNTRLVTDTVNFVVDRDGKPPQMLRPRSGSSRSASSSAPTSPPPSPTSGRTWRPASTGPQASSPASPSSPAGGPSTRWRRWSTASWGWSSAPTRRVGSPPRTWR
ncbi:MAG: hypothetical protein QOG43_1947 [Actinomycetota bacterium]|nr:hypothetical protein [Actinomycetota bacterium]